MPRPNSTCFVRFPAPPAAWLEEAPPLARAPLLERLLCRADECATAADWRREAFELIAAPGESWPGICPAALYRAFGPLDAPAVYLATPVRYVPTLTRVHLAADGLIALEPAEAAQLAADFNRLFAPAQRLLAAPTGALFCVLERPLIAETQDPAPILGEDVGRFQAGGRDAPAWRALASEIEMWLHEHPVNRERERRGAAALGGLWLWGGGAPLARPPCLAGWAGGADVFFAALDRCESHPRDGRSGVVCVAATPGSAAWRDAETRWLEPALGQLAARRHERLVLSAGRRAYRLGAPQRRRFWRRARPWWEYFA